MRVRITRRRPGEVDGIELGAFEVGLTYDVSPSLATYLIMTGTAEPIMDERPALVVPVEEVQTQVTTSTPSAVAADKGVPAGDSALNKEMN